MLKLSGNTALYTVIGNPVKHSSSPAIHTESFKRLGVDAIFNALTVTEKDLADAVAGLRALGVRGYSVTMPLKTKIAPYLDEVTEAATLMNAINVVEMTEDGKLIGHNTDGQGFMRNLKEHGVDVIGKTITLIGAGGAGSAIFTQAALDGVKEIRVFNVMDDFYETTKKRIAELTQRTNCSVTLTDLADTGTLRESANSSDLLVNATRVGMAPNVDDMPVPDDIFRKDLAVADTVYNPAVTTLLRHAIDVGAPVVGGLGMLLWQASIAEEIWVGQEMPVAEIAELIFPDHTLGTSGKNS